MRGPALRSAMRYVTLAWVFGAIWQNAVAGAPITAFARALGADYFEFGLLSALPFLAALLSLPASYLIDRTGQRSLIFFVGLYINRLLWIPIGLLPIAILSTRGLAYGHWAIFAFLSLIFLMHAGQAMGGPAWVNWMADIVPARIRGRYFARRRRLGTLTAIPAALLAGWYLDHRTGVSGGAVDRMTVLWTCATIFIVAGLIGLADIALHHPVPHRRHPKPGATIAGMFKEPLRNRRFMSFSLCAMVLWFSVAAQGTFVNKYLLEHLKLDGYQVQLITLVLPLAGHFLSLNLWGKVIDRYGKRPALALGMAGLIPVGIGWCLMSGGYLWIGYLLSVVGAIAWVGVEIANTNLILDLSGVDEDGKQGGTAYVAMNSMLLNISGFIGGIVFGWIAQSLANFHYDLGVSWLRPLSCYEVLFGLSVIFRIAAFLILLPRVHEQDARPTVEALRFVTENIYDNLMGAALLPVKIYRAARNQISRD